MNYGDIIGQLTAWFEPHEYKERKLPGNKTWFYVPHQIITQRLNDLCGGYWSSKVTHTMISGEFTVIMVEVIICGVSHVGIGDSEQPEYNEAGNSKMIGTPAVRAFRAALKDAFERHGICAHLDEQTGNKQKFVDYTRSKGDLRAYKAQRDNGWQETLNQEAKPVDNRYKVEDTKYSAAVKANNGATEKKISDGQIKRLLAIAKTAGLDDIGLKNLIADFGFISKKDITVKYGDKACAYDRIVAIIEDPTAVSAYLNTTSTNAISVNTSSKLQKAANSVNGHGTTATAIAPANLLVNQNNYVISTLMQVLGFEQRRVDTYFSSAFPGLTAEMLDGEQIRRIIKKLCRTYANYNEAAIASIDNAVVGKYMMGIPLSECLTQWIDGYGLNNN